MPHNDLIKSMSREQLAQLTARSNQPGLVRMAIHGAAIVATGWFITQANSLITLLVLQWTQGVLIVFLFTLLHETIHRTAFKTIWLNVIVARMCSFLIVLPERWFRYFHMAHHHHTQDPERDPELAFPKPKTRWEYVRYISGIGLWWSHFSTLVRNARGQCRDDFVPVNSRHLVVREAQLMLALYALIALCSWYYQNTVLLAVWVFPVLIGQPMLRAYLLAEHSGCALEPNVFKNTRTIHTNELVRRLAWNMPYHVEHHALPAIPFHKLPEIHRLIREHMIHTEHGYVRFNNKYFVELKNNTEL